MRRLMKEEEGKEKEEEVELKGKLEAMEGGRKRIQKKIERKEKREEEKNGVGRERGGQI